MQTQTLRTLGMFTILTLVVTLSATSASAQYSSYFVANLDGAQQGTSSPGTGFGRVTLDDTNPMNIMVRVSVSYSNLQGKATMIHVYGPAAEGAPPTVRFTVGTAGGTSGFVRNSEFVIPEVDAIQAQLLRAGLFYIVLKTTLHPFGEIRGQILPNNPYVGTLNGAQHNNLSAGTAYTHISLNASETKMMVTLKYRFILQGQSASLYGAPGMLKDLGAADYSPVGANFGEYYDKLFDVTPQEVALLKSNGFFGSVTAANPANNILGRIQAPGRGRRRSDFDGDGSADVAVWRPSDGIWYVLQSSNSVITYNAFGLSGDSVVSADYDGDGQTDRAVFRANALIGGEPLANVWLIEPSSTYDPNAMGNFRIEQFGFASDFRLPHDYDGDGQTDIAVWRPETAVWYIMQSATKTLRAQQFGQVDDKPFAGDFDGDRRTDLAVARGPVLTLHILRSSDGAVQSVALEDGDPELRDFDGDGKTDIAVIQSVNGAMTWRIRQSSNGALVIVTHGELNDFRVAADYDGDGKADPAVYRYTDGTWRILQSTNGQVRVVYFGLSSDVRVPAGR